MGVLLGVIGVHSCFEGWMDGRLASLPVSPLAQFGNGSMAGTRYFRFVGRAHSESPLPAVDGAPLALQWVRVDHYKSFLGPDDNRMMPDVFQLRGDANSQLTVKTAEMDFDLTLRGRNEYIPYRSHEQIERSISKRISPSFSNLRYSTYYGSKLYVFSVPNDALVTVIGTFERRSASTPILRAKVVSLLMGDALDHEVHRIASIDQGIGAVFLIMCAALLLKAWSDSSKIRSGRGLFGKPDPKSN